VTAVLLPVALSAVGSLMLGAAVVLVVRASTAMTARSEGLNPAMRADGDYPMMAGEHSSLWYWQLSRRAAGR